ncbi:sugar phosphate isomerase/epimerase [Flavobacterium alkalisoli]|uniref:Sugar phosphate isomerase/epimerase n=1 Tax=Flavobacterium alkalisoli TaxID=2602769 RepID=A0A5B9FN89_9FLAO|nr:TIM barrel protein [Flavobacterium alkalisoli]QEE48454.1 sugar phosphate isomerase/epimerase [Flavobacterium alkalisoli]
MNRRHFISATGKAGIATGLAGNIIPSLYSLFENPEEKPFFKLSLAQWSLHKAILETKTLSNLDFAKKAKELGFEGVEYVSQLYQLDENNQKASLKKLIKELKLRSNDQGIKNVLIMVDNEGELAAADKKERELAVSNHSKWVDAAAELGCHSIRVNLFGTGTEHDFHKWQAVSYDGLSQLSRYASNSGVNIIVENHGGLSSDAEKLIKVIRSINKRNCGLLPDFGNFCVKRENGERWGAPCIEEYDRYKGTLEMMPFAYGVSAKSYDFNEKGDETTIDYYRMLKIVKEAGYNGFIGVEYEGSRLSEEEGILATKALLLKAANQLK